MDRSRKSQIASAARSREREGGGEERLDKREKASKKGGVVRMRTAMSLWCGSEEWKEWGRGRGGCKPGTAGAR